MDNLRLNIIPAAIRVIVQARMGSARLPGKTLAFLGNRTLLEQVIGRLQAASQYTTQRWEVCVATSTLPADDAIAAACDRWQVPCFRGDSLDVLARYAAAAADLADDDIVLRATADNPLYCPRRAAAIVQQHIARGDHYTCIANLSYVVPEVMRAGTLRAMAARNDLDAYCHEHVTPWLRRPNIEPRVSQLPETWLGLRPEIRLTVDTAAELERMRRLIAACGTTASLENLYAWCDGQERSAAATYARRRSA